MAFAKLFQLVDQLQFQSVVSGLYTLFLGEDSGSFLFIRSEQILDLVLGFVSGSCKILFFATISDEFLLELFHLVTTDLVVSLFQSLYFSTGSLYGSLNKFG